MHALSPADRKLLGRLTTPRKIQDFLDSLAYSSESRYRCPREVLRDRRAHCVDGALFAASALRRIGHEPLLLDMIAVRDDDHVIAPFRRHGAWGAVAKSNVVGLRYREPIHRSIRELVMTYFELYYNVKGEKTLRTYSQPYRLKRWDARSWEDSPECLDDVVVALEASRHHAILTPAMRRGLSRVDRRLFEAGLLGSDPDGLYVP